MKLNKNKKSVISHLQDITLFLLVIHFTVWVSDWTRLRYTLSFYNSLKMNYLFKLKRVLPPNFPLLLTPLRCISNRQSKFRQ